ncbi:hypothetical protein E4U13_003736 [Claviceps humidiphila]|uniref:Uncharacterized protein n=1 Tax=Claviceps humidiphila TaxID=1294629 RepID=A0A9P7PZH7_9HYPO|nr:hypothetical protein E4U13_003736 [Claviceps humidiphila]
MLPARKALPFNHIIDGDETMFKSWHTAITSKLRSESAFISNHEQQGLFINEVLSMKVRRRVALEYSNGLAVNYNPAAGSTSMRRRPIASEPSQTHQPESQGAILAITACDLKTCWQSQSTLTCLTGRKSS